MEISLIYRKLLSSALICPSACPLAAFSGWSHPSRRAGDGPRLPPHWAKASWDYWSVSDVSISLCHHNALFPFFLSFSPSLPSPLRSRVLGFLSHDGFIGGPLLKRFRFPPDPFSLVLSAAWHIKGDLWVIEPWTQNIKLSACLAASKQRARPPTLAITYHLHPSSGRKLLVSLTNVYWRHLISKG